MDKPVLVVVSGAPCTGKSSLGRRIARTYALPYISKDGIKETLFDSLGWSDKEWSQKLGAATYELMAHMMRLEMAADISFMIEANFRPAQATEWVQTLLDRYHYSAIQIHCITDEDVLMDRFQRRWESGRRHPGHVDDTTYDHILESVQQKVNGPLWINARLLTVDTTDWSQVSNEGILRWVEKNSGLTAKV